MAIEAQQFNVFSPQLLLPNTNRDCVKFQRNMNHNEFNHLTGGEVPVINGGVESGLTYNFNTSSVMPTKRPLDAQFASAVKRRCVGFGSSSPPSLINAEFVSQIQRQQQAEIDRFVTQQTEKLRLEIEARQQTQTRMLASVVQNAVSKKLKEKDDEILRIRNLNLVLQERVKSLYVENQIWRDLAQTNEANANTLRTNLDQVLAQIDTLPNAVQEDAESSCGSCCGGDEEAVDKVAAVNGVCKKCGEKEASVLVLPCRHLCLCSVCGSGSALLRTCPVCDSVMNASVHVNLSS